MPGGPTLAWRMATPARRWRQLLATAERLPVDEHFPAPSVVQDGLHGVNLYRRNVPGYLLRAVSLRPPHAPVQLIAPSGDRFIPDSYYDAAERIAPQLRRRTVAGSHWAQRSEPELVASWIREFVGETEAGPPQTDAWLAPRRRHRAARRPARAGDRRRQRDRPARPRPLLAAHGARVLLVDRDEAALARAAESMRGVARPPVRRQ